MAFLVYHIMSISDLLTAKSLGMLVDYVL